MKRLLIIAGVVVGVLVLAVVLVPLFINVDSFRPDLEKKLGASLNRPVQIGKLSASIWSGGASAENISISDDPAFSKGAFLEASSLKVGLRLIPLIFSRQIKVTSITVEKPVIVLLRNAAGKWNYSSLGATSSAPAPTATEGKSGASGSQGSAPPEPSSASSAPEFSVDKFQIVNGEVKVGQSSGHSVGKEKDYKNVDLVAQNISFTTAMPFTLSMATPNGGTIKLDGQAGPLDRQDSSHTPFDAGLHISHLDVAATGFTAPGSGVAGIVDFEGKVTSDGRKIHSQGKATANDLKVVQGGSPTHEPVTMDYTSDYSLESDTATLQAGVHTGASTANATGTLDTKGEDAIAHLKLVGKDMAVNDLAKLLPAFGVVLPSGAALQGGTANLDMTAEGPLDRLVITGPANISGTHLTGYNLAGKLSALAAFTGVKQSNDTLIQTVSSVLRVTPDGLKADNILLDVPSMGTLTGSGTIDSKNNLNFPMVLKLATGAGSALGSLASLGGSQTAGIPFLIEGTSANPVFRPNLNMKNNLKNALLGGQNGGNNQQSGLGGLLGGVLKKKDNKKQ
ncbi:MAG TPA: AsmA family protein [Candidatus Angelobacter sp.]|nr:AsmA family protein [Candidatus Angelobacter sp.]